MAKKKQTDEMLDDAPPPPEPKAPEPVFCSPGDLIGTTRPDGGAITRAGADDLQHIENAAINVREALADHPAPDAKATLQAARWANIVGAVDLRVDGEFSPLFYDALAVLKPAKD